MVLRRLVCLAVLALFACSPHEGLSFAEEETRPAPAPRVPLTVRETAGVARAGEVLSTGIPLPRSLGVRDTRWLAVVDPSGRPVPADFRILARWNAGLEDRAAPIQWVLVTFAATVGAKQSAVYSLSVDGSVNNPPPPAPLTLKQTGDRIVVDTGAAVFSLSGGALFDEVRTGRSALITGSEMTLATKEKTARHSAVRNVRIEHAGPLSAVVVVEGEYDLPPVGKGGLGSFRRYVFTAGSPTAIVRQAVAWEGNLGCNGCVVTKDGAPNGIRLERVRDTLGLSLGDGERPATSTATIIGDFEAAPLAGPGPAWVRQVQRSDRHARLRFEAAAGSKKSEGDKADGGLLAVSGSSGSVAVALNHLHRYEPQALRLLEDGRLAIDLADGHVWLAHHQGMFATFAVSALPPRPVRADLDRLVWAPLNRPLRAWPDAAWFSKSDAVGEIPVGDLPKGLAGYDRLVRDVLERTVEQVDAQGIAGLMTYGVFPRYWGGKEDSDLRCKKDPSPDTWDDTFWCGAWTDYHNTLSTVPIWAMRTGEVEWLDELAVPGALRTLHTQIMQCAPGDPWFYCGQSPAGYGGYRADFNSSHAYFDNLFLYYWLTGDSTVVETLERGGRNMRRHMCGKPPCTAADPPDKASFTGRVAGQWLAVLHFLGLASADSSFLDDWRTGLARAVTHQYVEVERDGKRYGFLGKGKVEGDTYDAGPMWLIGMYDSEGLYRLMRDTDDAPIGEPPVKPSQVLAALARSIAELEPGEWPRILNVAYRGARRGGQLVEVTPKDRPLYGPERAAQAALLVRAGQMTGDRELLEAGRRMVESTLAGSAKDRAPLGKLQGQYLTRLHAAVARLANGAPAPPAPPPG
ncbi:MAG: hypothetical protein ACJ76J_01250 [Thermoanaerobaculia bacterium]